MGNHASADVILNQSLDSIRRIIETGTRDKADPSRIAQDILGHCATASSIVGSVRGINPVIGNMWDTVQQLLALLTQLLGQVESLKGGSGVDVPGTFVPVQGSAE